MHVRRKRALLMVMVVVLWTVAPALACLKVSAQPDCCHGMMQGCDDPAAMESMACCQVRTSDPAVPPSSAITSNPLSSLSQVAAWAGILPVPTMDAGHLRSVATSPSPPLSALSSILRI
jgi:hypothetical protein